MPKRPKENSNYTTRSVKTWQSELPATIEIATRGDFIDRFARTCTLHYELRLSISIPARPPGASSAGPNTNPPKYPTSCFFFPRTLLFLYRLASPICPKWWWWRWEWWWQCRWLCKSKPPTYRGNNSDRIALFLVFLAFDGFLHAHFQQGSLQWSQNEELWRWTSRINRT